MANDGNIDVGFGLDISQAQSEVRKLKDQLDGLMANFQQSSTVISNHVNNMTRDLKEALKSAGSDYVAVLRKLESATDRAISSKGQGTDNQKIAKATVKMLSTEMRTTSDAIMSSLSEELIKVFTLKLRNTNKAVDARLKQEVAKIEKLILNSSDAYLKASSVRDQINRQRTIDVYSNPQMLQARATSQQDRDQRFIRDNTDGDLIAARNARKDLANQSLKEKFLDRERLELEQKYSAQALIRKREAVENFDAIRADRIQRKLEESKRKQERAAAAIAKAADTDLVNAEQEQKRVSRQNKINTYGDSDLIAAKATQKQISNALIKERFLDEERIALEQKAREQALIRKRESVANFDSSRAERLQRKIEQNRLKQERAAALAEKAADTELTTAQKIIAEYNRKQTLTRANNISTLGTATPSKAHDLTPAFERINANGGADLMALQGRLMINYMAVGQLFSTVKGLLAGIVDLDREFTQFQAISASTNVEMQSFKSNLADVASAVPFTLTEMAQASTLLAQAGLSTSEVNDSIKSVAQFATATGSSLSEAVDVVSSTLTAFNLETSRTSDVANVFTSALNLSKLSVEKLSTALAYIGPTANEVGLTLEETTGVLGALSQSGLRASTIGTGFRALLVDLMNPSKDFQKALQATGLSLADVDVKSRGFIPVMETLKNAGFGAAEAYDSFEVRAASAFLALQNNMPLAYEMQKAFVLSSAATKASETQMKSLSNTAKNFGSVVSSISYKAFEPIVAVLQGVLASTTSVLKVFGEIPGLLQTVSIAATGVGSALAISLGVSLFRSFAKMIPMVGTLTASLGAFTSAMATATSVTVAFEAVLSLIKANWVGLLITGATAATMVFMNWKDATQELEEELDKLHGRVNDLQGAADASGKKITSIEQALEGVISKKDELDKNPLMREAKIDELRSQFSELGVSITSNTTSVTELIAELHKLHQTSSQIRALELSDANRAREDELKVLNKKKEMLVNPSSEGSKNVLDKFGRYFNPFLMRDIRPDQIPNQVGKIQDEFGPKVASAFKLATGDTSEVDGNVLKASGILDQLREIISKTKDKEKLGVLQSLEKELAPIVEILATIKSSEVQLDTGKRELAKQRLEGSDAYSNLNKRQEAVASRYKMQFDGITKQDMSREERIAAYERINDWLETEINVAIDSFEKSVSEVDGSDAKLLGEEVRNKIESLKAKAASQIIEGQDALAKELTKKLEKEKTSRNKQTNLLVKAVNKSDSDEILKISAKGLKDYMLETKTVITTLYQDLITNTRDEDKKRTLQEDLDRALEDLQTEIADQEAVIAEKQLSLKKESLQRQKSAMEDNVKAIRTKIDDAINQLKKTSPGEAFDELTRKIQELYDSLSGELGKIRTTDIQMGSIDIGEPISETVAKSAGSALEHFMKRGMSKAGAAAIAGNLAVESNFNPKAVGDSGTAFGVGQWRFDRRRNLVNFAKSRGSHVADAGTQYDFVLHELQKDYPQLFNRLMSGNEDPAALSEEFMRVYERPNKDPKINHVAKRRAYAANFANTDSSSIEAEQEKGQNEVSKIVEEKNAEQVKITSDAIIKNMKARVNGLKLQVRVSDNATSIEEIQKSVEDAHAKIMDEELKKFDAENLQLKSDNRSQYDARRSEKIEELRQNMNSDILKIMEEHYKAAEEELNRPVETAKARLEVAQKPGNENKYTQTQIQQLQQDVENKEREASANRILLIEQQIAEVRRRAAEATKQFGADSPEALQWRQQENDLMTTAASLKEKNLALDQARAQQAPSVNQGIASATQMWAQQNGILDSVGQMIPLGKQVEATWGQVLSGLQSGFSTFFMNIFSGNMKAKDAFKQLGTSILQMFTQIIAKALANQIIMSLFGGGKMGGGSFLGGFFGVVGGGGSTGGLLPGLFANGGIPRAANGMTSVAPFRDNMLVNVMPGEGILRKSAMDVIGQDTFTELNNLGNRKVSDGTTYNQTSDQKSGSGVVNVYVVSEQPTSLSANDVVAIISSDIQRRGVTKQLIQSVAMGTI